MLKLQRRLRTIHFPCFILRHKDVLPVVNKLPNQTAVSYSRGCLGNGAMENSCDFPCGKGLWGSNTAPGLLRYFSHTGQRENEFFSKGAQTNLNQTVKQHWEATHKQGVHSVLAGEPGEIYGKPPATLHPSVLYLYQVWVRTLNLPSPKTEACLNIARVEMGAKKGSEWERRRERKRENENEKKWEKCDKRAKEKLWERPKENKCSKVRVWV